MLESLLLIVVVVEAVWILSSIFRGAEEERKGPRPPLNPRASGAPNRQRPPATTVDRFLEEINRRRREAAERQPGATAAPVLVITPEKPRPAQLRTESVRRPAAAATPNPPVVKVPPVRRPAAAEVVPVEPRRRSAAKPTSRSAPPPAPPPAVEAVEVVAVTQPVLMSVPKKPAASPQAAQLIALLHSPQSLRAALLLHEVFGPPLCERGR